MRQNRRQFMNSLGLLGLQTFVKPADAPVQALNSSPICIFSTHLQWLSVPEMAKTVAELGFDGIDLTVRKGGHVAPERVAQDLPRAVEAIRKAGLEVPMIVTDIVALEQPFAETVIQTAGQLGIKHYRMGWADYDPALGIAQSLEKYRQQWAKLAAFNQKHNIQGAYQNHAGARVGASIWDLWQVIKDFDPRWLGCQYDIKHAVAEGGMSWVNGLELLKSHIKCLDIKDFYWAKKDGKWQHQLVPLGEGMVDYPHFLALLRKHNITGPMSLHYEFALGGAELGKTQLSMPQDKVLEAMKKDLSTLKLMLQKG
jgi:L-ribulose-5-phosphate 3-epimerase